MLVVEPELSQFHAILRRKLLFSDHLDLVDESLTRAGQLSASRGAYKQRTFDHAVATDGHEVTLADVGELLSQSVFFREHRRPVIAAWSVGFHQHYTSVSMMAIKASVMDT